MSLVSNTLPCQFDLRLHQENISELWDLNRGDLNFCVHSKCSDQGRERLKSGEERKVLWGEFMEHNAVERTRETETDTKNKIKGADNSDWLT